MLNEILYQMDPSYNVFPPVSPRNFIRNPYMLLKALKLGHNKAIFVSRKVVSGKPLSKLSYIYLSLSKLINRKHFPVKEKFGLIFKKVFS